MTTSDAGRNDNLKDIKEVATDAPPLPRGWTSERRRVKLATPEGEQSREMTYYKNSIGMEFAAIPAGEFMMGSNLSVEEVDRRWPGGKVAWYEDEHPRHRVRITRPLYLGVCEVSRGQFARFVRETGYQTDGEKQGKSRAWKDGTWGFQDGANWRDPGFEQTDEHPVVCVSWNDAKAFCAWLSKREGVTYRLPTEAEWEYAARAGSTTIWYWGDDELGAQGRANVAGEGEDVDWPRKFKGVRDGYTYTSPVGRFTANAFGLHDMLGNAYEWCEDWSGEEYYANSPTEDPQGPATGTTRVQRGGSWIHFPRSTRTASHSSHEPDYPSSNFGFRVVRLASR